MVNTVENESAAPASSDLVPVTYPPPDPLIKPEGRRPVSRKTIYTLNVGNYEPRITELTFPLMRGYAEKIGAEFEVIDDPRWHWGEDWPINIHKFQVSHRSRRNNDEWSIFLDADTLVSPEMFDVTDHLSKDTVAHNGRDMAGVRWKYDKYFKRDGRHFGSCTWMVIASEWTVEDLWRFPEGTLEDNLENIHITVGEHNSGHCKAEHLIDDYTLSRNIARFGLKTDTVIDICGRLGWKHPDGRGFNPFLYHIYSVSAEEKLRRMLSILSAPVGAVVLDPRGPDKLPPYGSGWGLMDPEYARHLQNKWGLKL